jgi:hypothetical protein
LIRVRSVYWSNSDQKPPYSPIKKNYRSNCIPNTSYQILQFPISLSGRDRAMSSTLQNNDVWRQKTSFQPTIVVTYTKLFWFWTRTFCYMFLYEWRGAIWSLVADNICLRLEMGALLWLYFGNSMELCRKMSLLHTQSFHFCSQQQSPRQNEGRFEMHLFLNLYQIGCSSTTSEVLRGSFEGPSGVLRRSCWGLFGVLRGSFGGPSGVLRGSFGVLRGSFGGPAEVS